MNHCRHKTVLHALCGAALMRLSALRRIAAPLRVAALLRVAAIMSILALVPPVVQAGVFEDFFKAVEMNDAGTIERLIQRGFDINARDEKGQPALLLVLREGSFRAAEALLRQPRLDIDAPNAVGETALMMAALKGHTDWARRLMERGAKVDKDGWTPLHYAASGPERAMVELLLDKGARIDARSPNGSTPLMMAARYGSEDSVKLLLARGAGRALRNERDLTAADFARLAGRDVLGAQLDKGLR